MNHREMSSQTSAIKLNKRQRNEQQNECKANQRPKNNAAKQTYRPKCRQKLAAQIADNINTKDTL